MKRLSTTVAVLLLVLLAGCPSTPKPGSDTPAVDTSMAARNKTCETLPAADPTAIVAVPDPAPAKPKPEPPPKPKALPRMWDYGAENCVACQEMMRILNSMMPEYAGRVDIRIINVYQEQQLTAQARIQVIPTQIFYDPEGEELFRHVGIYPHDSIVGKFREFGWE